MADRYAVQMVRNVGRRFFGRWYLALSALAIIGLTSACADSPSAPSKLTPIGALRYAPGDCVDELNPCPDPDPTMTSSDATGEAAPVDANDASAGYWPQSVFVVYNSPNDGSVMTGWATYAYSGATSAHYTFTADSFSAGSHETGGFTMDVGDRIQLAVMGSFTTESYHIDSYSKTNM